MWALLLSGCDLWSRAADEHFPLTVPVMRSAEPPPAWATDPAHPGGMAYWAGRRCLLDPQAPSGPPCSAVAPDVCATALAAPAPAWDVLVACRDPVAAERMFTEGADPAWIGRWHANHARWDPRLVDVLAALVDREPAEWGPAATALAAHETPETIGRLQALWDESPALHHILATPLAASTHRGLVDRLDRWCGELPEDYRCEARRRHEMALDAHPADDPGSALAAPWSQPDTWVEQFPTFQRVLLDAFERAASGDDPLIAVRGLRALALADRSRAAVVAARWDESGTTWEGWDLHTGLELYPGEEAWAKRAREAGGELPAALLLDAWVRSGMAFSAVDNGWRSGGPSALLQSIFARIPGNDPVFSDLDPDVRDTPFQTRVVIYAWWEGKRWRVAEDGDVSAAAVGLANALLEEMDRSERVGLTGDTEWVVVGEREVLAAAGREKLVTWYDPTLTTALLDEFDE